MARAPEMSKKKKNFTESEDDVPESEVEARQNTVFGDFWEWECVTKDRNITPQPK